MFRRTWDKTTTPYVPLPVLFFCFQPIGRTLSCLGPRTNNVKNDSDRNEFSPIFCFILKSLYIWIRWYRILMVKPGCDHVRIKSIVSYECNIEVCERINNGKKHLRRLRCQAQQNVCYEIVSLFIRTYASHVHSYV